MTDSQNKLGEVFVRCWTDDAFKERFLANPKGVLAESGIKTDAKMDIEVVQNTANKMYITLPAKPLDAGELTDAQLDGASGGAGTLKVPLRPLSGAATALAGKVVAPNTQYAPLSTSGSLAGGYCYAQPC